MKLLVVFLCLIHLISSWKLAANLGFLFTENNSTLAQRFQLAKQNGFDAVEIQNFPVNENLTELMLLKNDLDLEIVLVNMKIDPDYPSGAAAISGQEENFKRNLNETIAFAKQFNARKIHILSGIITGPVTELNRQTFLNNMIYAASIFDKENISAVIEPISHYSIPGYFLNDFNYARDVINKTGSDKIKIMFDMFNMQLIQGNIINTLKEFGKLNGHVQIAQVPNRNEPNTRGEINLRFIIEELYDLNYDDYIGCQYRPLTNTIDGLSWIEEFRNSASASKIAIPFIVISMIVINLTS